MCRDMFVFFANFKSIADKLDDQHRLAFYDAITNYVFCGQEPDDPIISALLQSIKPSLDKPINRGGAPKGNKNAAKKTTKTTVDLIKTTKTTVELKNNSFLDKEKEEEIEEKSKPYGLQEKKSTAVDWLPPDKELIDRWNAIAEKFGRPKIQNITTSRRSRLRRRVAECGENVSEFFVVCATALKTSSFLRGESKDSDWSGADFDFFLQESSFQKAKEGSYNDSKRQQVPPGQKDKMFHRDGKPL